MASVYMVSKSRVEMLQCVTHSLARKSEWKYGLLVIKDGNMPLVSLSVELDGRLRRLRVSFKFYYRIMRNSPRHGGR